VNDRLTFVVLLLLGVSATAAFVFRAAEILEEWWLS
jgi:hypothetical protein